MSLSGRARLCLMSRVLEGLWGRRATFGQATGLRGYLKKISQLRLRISENPNRYWKDEYGVWRCPPGEAYAEPFGLFYRLRPSSGINWTYQRNINFLEDYFRSNVPSSMQKQTVPP